MNVNLLIGHWFLWLKSRGEELFWLARARHGSNEEKTGEGTMNKKGAEAPLEMIMFIRDQMRMRKAFLARWLLPLMR